LGYGDGVAPKRTKRASRSPAGSSSRGLPARPRAARQPLVFISHATEDRALADGLTELLVAGIGLDSRAIRNTSRPSTATEPGSSFEPQLAREIAGAKVVVAVVTERFVGRPFCLEELGAAWVTAEQKGIAFLPLAFGVTPAELSGILEHRTVLPASDAHLDRLRDSIVESLGLDSPVTRWNEAKRRFLDQHGAAPLQLVRGIVLRGHLVGDEEVVADLPPACVADLDQMQALDEPFSPGVFCWDRAWQVVAMYEGEEGIEALKLLYTDGRVRGQLERPLVSVSVSSATLKDVWTYPRLLRESSHGWEHVGTDLIMRQRVDEWPVEPAGEGPRGPRSVRLVAKRWRASPAELGLKESDHLRMILVTHFPCVFLPVGAQLRDHDFFMLATHLAVSGRTTYSFKSTSAVRWLNTVYSLPFNSQGLRPIDCRTLAPRQTPDPDERRRADLQFIQRHLASEARLAVPGNLELMLQRLVSDQPWDRELQFWVDATIDSQVVRDRLIIFCERVQRAGGPGARGEEGPAAG
jgi:hypothetical protein